MNRDTSTAYLFWRGSAYYNCEVLTKKQWRPPSREKYRGNSMSPRNRKACHSIGTTLLQSVAEIGTHSTMKSSRKTLHGFSPHIPSTPAYCWDHCCNPRSAIGMYKNLEHLEIKTTIHINMLMLFFLSFK
jgi:hypothetical protein